MKCFLHIGTEKTATTTIQSFLNLNRQILCDHGYLYPKSVGLTNQSKLAVAAYGPDRRDDLTTFFRVNSKEELLRYQDKVIDRLQEEIASKQVEKAIFSSEYLQSRLTKASELERLRKILEHLGFDEIVVIIYLRNPPELANSLYSTEVKAGSTRPAPPPPSDDYYANVCHHRETLEKFARVFGNGSITPRIFRKETWKNETIIDDFLGVVGIPNSGQFTNPKNRNTALSATSLEILCRLNSKIPRFLDGRPNPLHSYLVSYFEFHFNNRKKYVMPEWLAGAYRDAFRDSNSWVKTKFFPHQDSLFAAKKLKETKPSLGDSELDWVANLIFSAAVELPRPPSKSKVSVGKIKLRAIALLMRYPTLVARIHQVLKS